MAISKFLPRLRSWKLTNHYLIPKHPFQRTFIKPANLEPDDEWHPSDAGNSGLYLRRTFKHLGHKHWGFTIYRCTYGDEDAWSKFLALLHKDVREGLEYCSTEEMIDSFDCHVHENPSILDGASKEVVRKCFREWIFSPEAEAERLSASSCPIHVQGLASTARYAYCVHVDDEVLHSVLDSKGGGHVNIIKANWALPSEAEVEELRQHFDDPNVDPLDEGYEELEGCKMYDVGWMRVGFRGLVPDTYASLDWSDWETYYWRPPGRAFLL